MMGRKLAIACLAAVAALAMTACSEDPKDPTPGQDAGPQVGVDVGPNLPCGGGCQPGFKCQGNTCVPNTPPPCDPACATGQKCDTTQTPPVCVEICNAPNGCKPVMEVCNETTAQCDPLSCGGTKCEFGQGCYDPITGDAGAECSCLPARTVGTKDMPDTCASYGKVCDYNYDNPVASKCRLPDDKEDCIASVGCANGATCTNVSGSYMCLVKCQTGKDCPSVMDMCLPNNPNLPAGLRQKCWYNICASPDQPDQGSTPALERANYFKACDSSGTADGTCLPLTTRSSTGGVTDIGVCFQAGTAPTLGKCDPEADRKTAGTNFVGLCPVNQLCSGVQPDPQNAGKQIGICRGMCNSGPTPTPTTTCDTAKGGDFCMDVSGVDSNYGPTEQKEARLGFCFKSCNMYGTDAACSGQDGLGNNLGCNPSSKLDGTGYCAAVQPNAAGYGATCSRSTDPLEYRNECADRLFCVQMQGQPSGNCWGYCNLGTCSDETAFCGGCQGAQCQACTPDCAGKTCGSDGCGGTCGTTACAAGTKCNAAQTACDTCTPDCTGKTCGSDGCGGTCGTTACAAGTKCNAAQTACEACVPNCAHKTCGDDGCGGTCGTACGAGQACKTLGADQICYQVYSDAPATATLGECIPNPGTP